ncbi:MAG TPA: SDR family oxidoreductase [Armatimonadota bacterium]|nr:SDR family oxidoreductase [Armatimonadota bacterium]HOS44104.1 SDR family oxidoreductase [Armatimonadota bacterium]
MSILDHFSLTGKTALVTGAAGRYGRQMAEALAEAGARVVVASRQLDALTACAEEMRGRGYDVTALAYDQAEEASILALRDAAGPVDVLVNNAVLRPMRDGYADSAARFAASMDANATGLFLISRAFGDGMAARGRGAIINIGSIQGMVGPDPFIYRDTPLHGWYPDYFFHKGGLLNFTRFLASYYGRFGVRVNCVSPGGFGTDDMPEPFVRQYSERTLLGRLANDTDVKGIIVFLASDASAYITGTNIPVDGGYTAK